jgi:hypothetical protein
LTQSLSHAVASHCKQDSTLNQDLWLKSCDLRIKYLWPITHSPRDTPCKDFASVPPPMIYGRASAWHTALPQNSLLFTV